MLLAEDAETKTAFRWALTALHLESISRGTADEALTAARAYRFDLWLLDVPLSTMTGLEVVHRLRAEGSRVPFVLVTDRAALHVAVEAMKLGAFTVLEKPLAIDDLVGIVRAALRLPIDAHAVALLSTLQPVREASAKTSVPGPAAGPRSATERWARLVHLVVSADRDPKTLTDWARLVGVSRSVLCECCRLVNVSPHDARDFARVLRAISRCGDIWEPENVMDLADTRTVHKLMTRAGLAGRLGAATPTLEEFMTLQQWIPRNSAGVRELLALLAVA